MKVFDKLISDFTLVPNVKVGEEIDIHVSKDLCLIKEQEGNIPALYKLEYDGFKAEINVINGIVYGFVLRLDLQPRMSFAIQVEKSTFLISYDTIFLDFVHFLNNNDILWEVNKTETMEQRIVISVNSKLDFFFLLDKDDFGLFRVSVADMKLYESFL